MPYDRRRYPADWEQRAFNTKQAANWTCEACGRPCRLPKESNADLINRISTSYPNWARDLHDNDVPKLTRFTLTTAHPNHDPENPDAILKAWCAPCHCRYDLKEIPRKRALAAAKIGQLSLLNEP